MRIGFYHASVFHHAMLDPVQRLLADDFACARTGDEAALVAFAPDVVVLSEHFRDHLRPTLPNAAIVWTRHGLAGKRYVGESIECCDYACLSTAWARDDYARQGWRPKRESWITGFVPMDALHRAASRPRAHAPHLVYAPTHNAELTSLKALGKRWTRELRRAIPTLRITLKPHPHTYERDPLTIARLKSWGEDDPAVRLVEDPNADIYPLLADADVLLTDASSVMFYFLALDRPMVLFDNPDRTGSPRYDPEAYEWTWRHVGERIDTADALVDAVRRCLDAPAARADARAEVRARLIGDTFDGRCAQRVADHVRALA